MKKSLFFLLITIVFLGCDTKNNEDAANNPPSLPGAGQPPVFNGK